MTEMHPRSDRPLLLQAALDGELDVADVLAFERALTSDAELAAEYAELQALRRGLQALPKNRASADFRARMEALAKDEPVRRIARAPRWLPIGLAACFAFIVGGGLTSLLLPHAPPEPMQALVADHVRSRISGQPVDVASSERHTVKPWFATHTLLSPQVVDLASEGFPLIGGRVDVIGVTPVPTLVFRFRKHLISLAEVPNSVADLRRGSSSINGLAILTWRQGAVTYVAISDAAPEELIALKAAFEKATGDAH